MNIGAHPVSLPPTHHDTSALRSLFSKGLQFGNVTTLLELLDEKNLFREMRFSW